MIIYQIHQYGGVWEDAYDHIIGSYLRQERAEEKMEWAKMQYSERQLLSRHCVNCPIGDGWDLDETIAAKCRRYCDKFEYIDLGDDGFDCGNYSCDWDEAYFRIEEVEVEE